MVHNILMVIVLACCCKLIESGGTVNINLIDYINPKHRLSNDRCCEQGIEAKCRSLPRGERCEICTLECDNLFYITLSMKNPVDGKKEVLLSFKTGILAYKDTLKFQSNLTGTVSNPLQLPVTSYTGMFTLEVASFDDDEKAIDFIDASKFSFNKTNIPALMYGEKKTLESKTMIGNVSMTNISIWVQCDEHYYDEKCETYCKGRDDAYSHHECDKQTGQKKCLYGLDIANNCTFTNGNQCNPNPCNNSANCTDLNNDFKCICPSGYKGKTCLEYVNQCNPNPCNNSGNCTNLISDFKCKCPSSYNGKTCQERTIMPSSNIAVATTTLLEIHSTIASSLQTYSHKVAATSSLMHIPLTSNVPSSSASSSSKLTVTSSLIRATKHSTVPQVSSSVNFQNCSKTNRVKMQLKLTGEFPKYNEDNLKSIMKQIICREINTDCYGMAIEKCYDSIMEKNVLNLKDIKFENVYSNDTYYKVEFTIKNERLSCPKPHLSTCTDDSLYSSTLFNELLGAEFIELCNSPTSCKYQRARVKVNKKEEGKYGSTALIIGVTCGCLVVLVVLASIYFVRKKRLMKVRNLEDTMSIERNEEIESDTSRC